MPRMKKWTLFDADRMMSIEDFSKEFCNKTLSHIQMKWFRHIHYGGDHIGLWTPRGHGKTTLAWIYMLWRLCDDHDLAILVSSNTQPLASGIIKRVQRHLKYNKPLIEKYNIKPGTPWKFGLCYLEGGESPILQAIPTRGQMTGWRYDIVIFDDLISTKNIATEDLLMKIDDWVSGEVEPALNPKKQKTIFIGTRKGTRDYYDKVLTNPDYNCLVEKAIQDDGTALWPEGGFTIEELTRRRRQRPLFFAREYMNDPQVKAGFKLKRKWLRTFEQAPPPEYLDTFIGVDPGLGMAKTASWFAIAVVQIDRRNGWAYVVEFYRDRSANIEQKKKVIELYEKWEPQEVFVEAVFAYKYFADQFDTIIPRLKKIDYVHEKLAGNSEISKVGRVELKLAPLFEKGHILIRDPEHDYFTGIFVEEEYIAFPKGKCDMLDALVMACNSLYEEAISLDNLGLYAV